MAAASIPSIYLVCRNAQFGFSKLFAGVMEAWLPYSSFWVPRVVSCGDGNEKQVVMNNKERQISAK